MAVEEVPFVKRRATASFALLALSIAAFPWRTEGFLPSPRGKAPVAQRWTTQVRSIKNNDNDEEDLFETRNDGGVTIDQSLSRPLLNNPRDPKSLLFSDAVPSANEQQQEQRKRAKDNDMALSVWQTCKTQLPFVLTGARTPATADDNPIGGVYNIIFVRLPTILAGLIYGKNLILDGHGMIVDLGGGPFEVPPVVVGGALYVILR